MPTTFCVTQKITESADSPKSQSSGLNSSKTRTFEIFAPSDGVAYLLLRGFAPATDMVDGIPLEATPTYRVETLRAVNGGVNVYRGTVEYKHAGRDEQTTSSNELIEPFREKVTCSFSGTTAKVTTGYNQVKYGPEARDVKDAINVQYNGEVEGTDINVRTGGFTVSTVIPMDVATNDWFKDRFKHVWTVNNRTFRSWPRGCVALSGMDARQRADGNWEIDYAFVIQPDENISEIGGINLGGSVNKEGFKYSWVMFRPKDDGTQTVPEPIGAYIVRVYDYSDFGDLGISE